MEKSQATGRYWSSLAAFFLIATALSWGLWLPTIASQRGWIAVRIPVMPWGSFGPALAAILVAARSGGAGALLGGLLRWRARRGDYALALLGPLAVVAVAATAELAWQGGRPRVEHLDRLWLAPLLFLVVLVVGGPLGEEIGWRGFALPRLLPSLGRLRASLVLAVLWMSWHLPLFWLQGAAQEGGSLIWFGLLVATSAVLFTWFWEHTGGNLWLAVLLHAGINTASYGAPLLLPALERETLFSPVMCVVASFLALGAVRSWRRERPMGA